MFERRVYFGQNEEIRQRSSEINPAYVVTTHNTKNELKRLHNAIGLSKSAQLKWPKPHIELDCIQKVTGLDTKVPNKRLDL